MSVRSKRILDLARKIHNNIATAEDQNDCISNNNNLSPPNPYILEFPESPMPKEAGEEYLNQLKDLLQDVFEDDEVSNVPDLEIENNIHDQNIPETHIVACGEITPHDVYRTPLPSPPECHENNNCIDYYFCSTCTGDYEEDITEQSFSQPLSTPISNTSNISSLLDTTPSSTINKKKITLKTDKGKKRLLHRENWGVVRRKLMKNLGKSFENQRGKVVPEKQLKIPCKKSCRLKCFEKFSHEQRLDIFRKFWALGDRTRQWEYVIKYTKKQTKRRQTTEVTRHNRQYTFTYFLPNRNDCIKVCQTMFLNTISSGERIVKTAWIKYDGTTAVEGDKRGRYDHRRRLIDDDMIKSVCDHVNSFVAVESHYVRKSSKKLYLEEGLNISRMYKLYCEWFNPEMNQNKAQSLRQYRDIVNSKFNLGFHVPKKDRCDVCHAHENKNGHTQEDINLFLQHQTNKKAARNLKTKDKADAVSSSGDILAATFDFEKVLPSPHGQVSILYYKRKLSNYNFTVFNMGSKAATCYMWHEGIANRGSNEVSSCLFDFVKQHVEKGVKEFRFWSDNCSGQNRNRIVFSFYLYAAKEFGATHRFMEKGHTQNEGDSVHSVIERASERKLIYVPEEWHILVRWAKSSGDPYIVKEMMTSEFYNFKGLLTNKNWTKNIRNEKVQWSHIREIRVYANTYDRLEYKYDLEKDYETIIVLRSGTRNSQRFTREFELKQAYIGPIPISSDKYRDLNYLCQHGIIPERYHTFYKSIVHAHTSQMIASDIDGESD